MRKKMFVTEEKKERSVMRKLNNGSPSEESGVDSLSVSCTLFSLFKLQDSSLKLHGET